MTTNEAFEKYMSNRGYAVSYIGDGQYEFQSTQLNWDVWYSATTEANKRMAELEKLSVTNIMVSVVPGYDGQGEEVFAKSVSEVEKLISDAYVSVDELEREVAELNQSIEKLVEVIAAGADLNESYRKTIDAYEKAHKAALEEKTQARHDEALAYKHYHELKASNNHLREALEDTTERLNEIEKDSTLIAGDIKCIARNIKLIEATPAESLTLHDNELIEMSAKVCDEDAKKSREFAEPFAARVAAMLADEIRALKEVK